jgi:hypothetical protein
VQRRVPELRETRAQPEMRMVAREYAEGTHVALRRWVHFGLRAQETHQRQVVEAGRHVQQRQAVLLNPTQHVGCKPVHDHSYKLRPKTTHHVRNLRVGAALLNQILDEFCAAGAGGAMDRQQAVLSRETTCAESECGHAR